MQSDYEELDIKICLKGDAHLQRENSESRKAEELFEESKRLAIDDNNYLLAVEKLTAAIDILPLPKYEKALNKLLAFIESESTAETSVMATSSKKGMVTLKSGLSIRRDIHESLFNYQVDGVDWMYNLYLKNKGGILADDMGLGKTVQTIVLVSTLLESRMIHQVLIIAPGTLLINWNNEFRKWAPSVSVFMFAGGVAETRRLKGLKQIQKYGGVILSTYGLCLTQAEQFSNMDGKRFVWDYFILDEGHKIKNPTKTTTRIYEIPAKIRLLLTGTPVQNNLRELWILFDFVMSGTLLGSYRTFKDRFEVPILKGREKDASDRDKKLSQETAKSLCEIYDPYLLRRTKLQVFNNSEAATKLPQKFDLVIWIYLNEPQVVVYNDFLNSETIKELVLLANMKSALLHLQTLKKICDHPRLLPRRVWNELLNKTNNRSFEITEDELNEDDNFSIEDVENEKLIMESGKLTFCLQLLENLKSEGHKTLLFSQSTKMLDIIQRILLSRNWKLSRLDGRIVNLKKRDEIVNAFQKNETIPLCLLSSQVGGVGLTLHSADRVIIYDPCWNPATDSQAVDRAYRIGQKKEVIVYRLITCGTVEEKIYRRQIFKDSITKQIVGKDSDPTRYFSRQDLRQLFEFTDPKTSETFHLITDKHGNDLKCSETVTSHVRKLKCSNSVFGIHDHNKLFSIEEPEIEGGINLVDELKSARDNLNKECQQSIELLTKSGGYSHQFQLPVVSSRKHVRKAEHYKGPENPSLLLQDDDSLPIINSFREVHIVDDLANFQESGETKNTSVVDISDSIEEFHPVHSVNISEVNLVPSEPEVENSVFEMSYEQTDEVANESLTQMENNNVKKISNHLLSSISGDFNSEGKQSSQFSSRLSEKSGESISDESEDETPNLTSADNDQSIDFVSEESTFDENSDESDDSLLLTPKLLNRSNEM